MRTLYYVISVKIAVKERLSSIQGEYEKKDFISRIDRLRILPVHYSENYFSLVSIEVIPIKITFKVPPGVMPQVSLHGWNYHDCPLSWVKNILLMFVCNLVEA